MEEWERLGDGREGVERGFSEIGDGNEGPEVESEVTFEEEVDRQALEEEGEGREGKRNGVECVGEGGRGECNDGF